MKSTSGRLSVRKSRDKKVVSLGDIRVNSPGDRRKDGDIVVCSRYASVNDNVLMTTSVIDYFHVLVKLHLSALMVGANAYSS
ncbi:hypothetical protein MTR_6g038600 [Medicago truncatula]|uniref:Uncharacterized protein n=1 Tax=Medicago truncatula TaxID=3880 RepID=A0A072U9A8_MEDTR|nr:hypothetical protein MTR_6g038600 [Medicago truncatula]